jgi:signal peptidase I
VDEQGQHPHAAGAVGAARVHTDDDVRGDGTSPTPGDAIPADELEREELDRDETEPDEAARHGRKGVRSAVEWVAVIVGALAVALVIKTFLLQAFFIPSESMVPTLKVSDRVLVNKLSYKLHDVHRGDLVVFERPPSEGGDQIKDLIKRVIALSGETIELRDGRILIDGRILEEPYLPEGTETTNLEKLTVPEGQVFVMGDNRSDSRDSRFFGPIDESLIVGRAFIRVWPLTAIGLL